MCIYFPEFVPSPLEFSWRNLFSVTNTYCICCAFLLLCARDARRSQQRLFPGESGHGGVRWGGGVAETGHCSLTWSVQQKGMCWAFSVHDGQYSAILSRCSINSYVLTCSSSLWCLERNLFNSKQSFPGLRSYLPLFPLLNALFSHYSQLCCSDKFLKYVFTCNLAQILLGLKPCWNSWNWEIFRDTQRW